MKSGHMISRRLLSVLLVTGAFAFTNARPASAYEWWLSAMGESHQNYVTMFDHMDQWAETARRVTVFQVHAGVMHRLSDAQLASLIKALQDHHLALALLTPILPPIPGCPVTESYFRSTPNEEALRVYRLGGQVSYISFDEPIWFGSEKGTGTPCSRNIADLAMAAAPGVRELSSLFPNAKFGETEPTTVSAEAILGFSRELNKSAGVSLSFVHADIVWKEAWQPVLPIWRKAFQGQGLRYGLIIDGGGQEGKDSEWANQALARFRSVPPGGLDPIDDVVFMSWNKAPADYYPETTTGTMTSVASQIMGVAAQPPVRVQKTFLQRLIDFMWMGWFWRSESVAPN